MKSTLNYSEDSHNFESEDELFEDLRQVSFNFVDDLEKKSHHSHHQNSPIGHSNYDENLNFRDNQIQFGESKEFNFVADSGKHHHHYNRSLEKKKKNGETLKKKLFDNPKEDFYHLVDNAVKDARQKLNGLRNKAYELYDKENIEIIRKAKQHYSNHLKETVKDEKIVKSFNVLKYITVNIIIFIETIEKKSGKLCVE